MDLTNIKLNKVPLRTNQCKCKLTPAVLWVYWCTLTTSRDYAVLSTATPHTGGSCTLWVFVWPLLSSLTAQRLAIGPYSLIQKYKWIQFTLCFILRFIYLKLSSLKQMYIKCKILVTWWTFLYIEYNEYIKKINIGCSFCGILPTACTNLPNWQENNISFYRIFEDSVGQIWSTSVPLARQALRVKHRRLTK